MKLASPHTFMLKKPCFRSGSPEWILSFILILLTFAVFSPVRHHQFISFDDDKYIYENPFLKDGLTWKSLHWALTADLFSQSPHADFWIPLTFLSHLLTVELFGMNPSAHHMVNVLLHGMNTVLLFWILRQMTGALWLSAGVAGLFGVHPLHVESVAWVTERKDVLSTLFWLLTTGAYFRYVAQPTGLRYFHVVLGMGLGLMAKPMLMTLPFVLLLLDFWPLGRMNVQDGQEIRQRIREKVPLFVLSALSIGVTYLGLRGGGHVLTLESHSLWTRIENALVSYTAYLGKTIWPQGLAILYPHPGDTLSPGHILGSMGILAAISAWVIWRRKRQPYLVVGWFWYLGTLVPTLGLVQAGYQAMADRYTYIPLIGLFIMAAWGVWDLLKKSPYRQAFAVGIAGVTFPALMICAWIQVQHWKNTKTVFEHAIRVTENNYVAHHNLGFALEKEGRTQDAIQEYSAAIKINPDFALSHYNIGILYQKIGRLDEAARSFEKTVTLHPNFPIAHFLLGNIYFQQRRLQKAIQAYHRALDIAPNSPGTHNNLGRVYMQIGEYEKATREFKMALKLYPQFTEAQKNLEKAINVKTK